MDIGDKITINLPAVEGQGETRCQLALGRDGLTIHPEETGIYEGDFAPILLEFYERKVRLVVWGDINNEDPTHAIDLSGALESNRNAIS